MYKLGLLGENIGYTLSPVLHGEIFRYASLSARFDVFDTPRAQLKDTVRRLKNELDGFNVTKPYKQDIIAFLDCDESGCHAVNTVKCGKECKGYNTDGFGFMKSFSMMSDGVKSVLVLGAGGAARVVVKELEKHGFDVYIKNRTEEKAKALAEEFGASVYNGESAHAVVNCTSCGFKKGEDSSEGVDLSGVKYAYDLIYSPNETEFLKRAKCFGARTKNGLDMLVYQGIKSDSLIFPHLDFTEADYEKIRGATVKKLKEENLIG